MYGFFMLDLVTNPLLLKDHKSQIDCLFLLLCLLVVAMLLTLGVGEVLLAMPMPIMYNLVNDLIGYHLCLSREEY